MSDVYVYITMRVSEEASDVNNDTGMTEDGYDSLVDALSKHGTDIVIRRTVAGVPNE